MLGTAVNGGRSRASRYPATQ